MSTVPANDAPDRRGRGVGGDDLPVVRFSVRALLDTDERFEVVAEGTNGREAIALATEHQPDLVLLDRQMPVMGGMEAIPGIREHAPHTAIVLYTAFVDGATAQAALAAGAADVLEKGTSSSDLVDGLATILLSQWADPDAADVRVGPIDSAAARVWIDNTTTIIDALRAHPEVVEVPADVLELFERFLDNWREIAW